MWWCSSTDFTFTYFTAERTWRANHHTAEPHLATFLQRSIPTPMVPLPGLPEEQFTIVMQTYRREGLLRKVLPHYCNMSLVNRILVVWNNINTSVPLDLYSLECSRAELIFLQMQKNTDETGFNLSHKSRQKVYRLLRNFMLTCQKHYLSQYKR